MLKATKTPNIQLCLLPWYLNNLKLNHVQLNAEPVGSELCRLPQTSIGAQRNLHIFLETVIRITWLHRTEKLKITVKNKKRRKKGRRERSREEGGKEKGRKGKSGEGEWERGFKFSSHVKTEVSSLGLVKWLQAVIKDPGLYHLLYAPTKWFLSSGSLHGSR